MIERKGAGVNPVKTQPPVPSLSPRDNPNSIRPQPEIGQTTSAGKRRTGSAAASS
jgi:hypothetical protein